MDGHEYADSSENKKKIIIEAETLQIQKMGKNSAAKENVKTKSKSAAIYDTSEK